MQPNAGNRPPVGPLWTILGVLSVAMFVALWRASTAGDLDAPLPALQSRIDPNTAPWWELMALPDIGESTARKIVEYREARADRAPVFRTAADLEPVPDIGPKTIARIASHLRFDE